MMDEVRSKLSKAMDADFNNTLVENVNKGLYSRLVISVYNIVGATLDVLGNAVDDQQDEFLNNEQTKSGQ